MRLEFLSVEDVLAIQQDQIARYGGEPGLRDPGLLESAVAQPQATFGGQYLHADIFLMAAAYFYHIAQSHAFIDGNKRAAYVATVVFLQLNGVTIPVSEGLYTLALSVAKGEVDKATIAGTLREMGTQDE